MDNETYDLITTLSNKLQEIWRIDEFVADAKNNGYDTKLWKRLRQHDQDDVDNLLQALKQRLSGAGGAGGAQ